MLKPLFQKAWTWITSLLNELLVFVCNLIERIPPHDLTVTRIRILDVRIRIYWETHKQLPKKLSDLPILKGRDNSVIDGWGRPIKYDIIGTSAVTLSSFGADGKAGGTGLNQNIAIPFYVN
jgi:hypothetical protein